jgi:RNA polymerase sigma-70 factor (ECF subfamily)
MGTLPNELGFALTRWTLVERTRGNSPEARAALSELCTAYYGPVVAFLRRQVHADDAATDLAHEFFARLLEGGALAAVDRQQGRFRNYLLGAVKHFLLNERRDAGREKRGGGRECISLSAGTDTSPGIDVADQKAMPSDAFFDRQWALAIIERALGVLQQESEADHTVDQFAVLKPWLSIAGAPQSQAEAADQLGITENALKVAIHRLRKRFRQIVRLEVSQTLNNPAELEEEMRYLIDALAKSQDPAA